MTHHDLNSMIKSGEILTLAEPVKSLVGAGFSHIKPEDFETLLLRMFEALGFSGSLTPVTGDEGVDVLIEGMTGPIVVQCKRYEAGATIGAKDLREFLGAIVHAGAVHGYFVTTSTFSDQATKFCQMHDNMTLIDGESLKRLFAVSVLHPATNQQKTSDRGPDYEAKAKRLYEEYLEGLVKLRQQYRVLR